MPSAILASAGIIACVTPALGQGSTGSCSGGPKETVMSRREAGRRAAWSCKEQGREMCWSQ